MAFYRYLKTEPAAASSWLFYCWQLQIENLKIICLAQKWCNISTWTLRLCLVRANLSGWRDIFRTLHDLYRPFSCQSVLMKHESMFAFFVISWYWNFGIATLGDDVRFSKLKFRNHFCAITLTTDWDIFGLIRYTFVIHGRCFGKQSHQRYRRSTSWLVLVLFLRVDQPPQLYVYPWLIY